MPKIVPGGRSGWLGETNTPVANTLGQWAAMASALRQLIGNANIFGGNTESTDPLTAPFHLYVDFDRGSDIYVTGDYNAYEATGTDEQIIAQKLKRVREQRLYSGYTEVSPFKTLNRAVKEAEIITSLAWYTFTDERAHRDCVIIHMGSGPQPIYNHPGTHSSAVAITAWGDGKIPTWQELIAFNNDTIGSVLLPRGAAFHGEDLRKCVLVPMWAPPAADIAPDYSNIRTVLSLTPDVHAVDFTFRDPIGQSESLHLLYGVGYASQAELEQSYAKTFAALGSSANLSAALTRARLSEYQVVGPISGTPSRAWDTVRGASAYPERISLRTEWGMGGLFIDGRKLQGLRSTVTAQYTVVQQQTDLNSIQIYSGGSWITPPNYQAYLDAQPNDTRIKPERMHCQVLAVGPAFVSTVSNFGVGPAVQVYADLGAEVTSSNGNFTGGNCAAIARGYKDSAFPQDKNWGVDRISAPLNPSALPSALSKTTLGTVSAVSSTTITLAIPLTAGASNNIPAVLEAAGYSLTGGNYVWVENPFGDDWRALLTGAAWSTSSPGVINITTALAEGNGDAAPVPVADGSSLAIGKKVYIRRVVDSRTTAQRRASLRLVNTAPTRIPPRGTVLQTTPAGTGISRVLTPETTANTGGEVLIVNRQGGTIGAVTSTAEITIRRGAASVNYAASTYYRKGQVVKALNKHWQAKADFVSVGSTPDPALWGEIYRHMPEQYNPADKVENECPQIKFDVDIDPLDNSTTCGINWATIFTSAGSVRDQFRSGVDALGVYAFLRALGFSDAAAWSALTPRTSEALRLLNPASSTDFPTAPSGSAASGRANWSVEFRRATTISLLGFTYDVGAGMGTTYSTWLPQAQKTISPENLFSSYFTAQGGARVVVRGTNEEGQEVTVRGLTDAETGELTLAGDLGGNDIDPPQQLENGSIVGTVDFSGVTDLTGGNAAGARASTTRYGFNALAPLAEALKTGSAAPIATADSNINAAPEAVTVPFLNAWKSANQLVSALAGELFIYVDGSKADRSLAAMLALPPTAPANAVPSLARAAEYANYVLTGSETTAVIRIAAGATAGAGYYLPNATWTCNVRLESWNSDLTAMPFPSNSGISATGVTNYFAGEGYDNGALIPQFIPFRLYIFDAANVGSDSNGTRLCILCQPYVMSFRRSWEFRGGFSFLGLAEVIKWVAGDVATRAPLFIINAAGLMVSQVLALTYSTNTSTNVDALLRSIRTATGYNGAFTTATFNFSVIQSVSRTTDTASLFDCIFGPGLPSHKENLGGAKPPYIDIQTEAPIRMANLYLRGNTTITSAGIGLPVSATGYPIEGSATRHYGSSLVQTSPSGWTFRQFYHTFIGCTKAGVRINIERLSRNVFVRSSEAPTDSTWNTSSNRSFYADLTGRLLPNHIHLLKSNGSTPGAGDFDNGPFLDQFIHAPSSISFDEIWDSGGIAGSTVRASCGFVGRFGSNGHNTTKTRGILLGNQFDEPEGGAIQLGAKAPLGAIWAKAGATNSGLAASRLSFVTTGNTTTFGEGFPAGNNPVITSTDSGVDLNLGGRSWRAGISPQYGSIVRPGNIII
jgi:hypothetical protein